MKKRIDHATVVTCRGDEVVVLDDTSITFEGGVITRVGPTAEVSALPRADLPSLAELKGRPLGTILMRMGAVSLEEVERALEHQKTHHGVIGQTLVSLGCATEADVGFALAVQAGREPAGVPTIEEVEVIDGRCRLVIPGLINTHHHLFQSLTRCLPEVQNAGLFDWLTRLYQRWQHLGQNEIRQAALISAAELLLNGCTTTSDHMYLFPAGGDVTIESILEAAEVVGIRIHACRGSMDLGQSSGGLPPDACVERAEDVLADCVRVIERFHDPAPLSMRRIDLAPCAPFNVTPELFDEMRELAKQHDVLLHTHIAETLDEQTYCVRKSGIRPIEYLHRHDWLGPTVYLAHCVHLNEEEIGLLAATRTGVAHCPSSNMRLGCGIAPVRAMLDAGVKVGLGVDGPSSNASGHVLAEARQALLLQRVARGPEALTPAEAFRLATAGGAGVLNRPQLGRIDSGCAADMAIYDANDIGLAGGVAHDPLAALVLCQMARPRSVIVGGCSVAEDGQLCGIEIGKVVSDFNQMIRRKR